MKRELMVLLVLLAWAVLEPPLHAQEATETPVATAEPLATPTALPYAWCGYLLLEGVVIDSDALALLAALFPPAGEDAPAQALMQWRARPDGSAGILEGCHVLPVERWRVVSLLQQGTGMEYAQMEASLQMTEYSAEAMRAYLEAHATEWEPADDAPIPEATPEP